MTSTLLSRRDLLKGTAALAATASVSVATTTRWHRAEAQESSPLLRARIDSVLRQAVEARDVPGVVAMAAADKGLLYEGAFGTRVLDNGPAMTLDTVFRIASMTKTITSVAAMQLVEQGKLTLNDPVPNIDSALDSPQALEGFDTAGAPGCVPPASDHVAPPADSHGGVQLRDLGREYGALRQGDGDAFDRHWQGRGATPAAGFRPR
jgi:CubicO group peptidase (beta-lactamase class C family)